MIHGLHAVDGGGDIVLVIIAADLGDGILVAEGQIQSDLIAGLQREAQHVPLGVVGDALLLGEGLPAVVLELDLAHVQLEVELDIIILVGGSTGNLLADDDAALQLGTDHSACGAGEQAAAHHGGHCKCKQTLHSDYPPIGSTSTLDYILAFQKLQ